MPRRNRRIPNAYAPGPMLRLEIEIHQLQAPRFERQRIDEWAEKFRKGRA